MKNLEILKKGYQNFAEGNIEAVLSTWAEDIVWEECPGMPMVEGDGKIVGRNAVLEKILAKIPEYIDGFNLEIREFVDGGDKIVMVGYYNGTYKATGKKFHAQATHTWTMKDGKSVHFYQAVDTATIINP
ncbi:nuclear transport factor 2 family protein [Mangrovibacterium diazotrophicum]|uniref:SnoaL-like domain-containing protein n=1 Tax=Mangrovibacterium diazotrophicum TaxID=1261403 RepID=A0A419W435_9BACT|nr:nuclear transport factor 2 family protein [Mangrovibacterium diazotrophicum]RKD90214.1 hypothetical protein BC643_0550 [Mangrovibacterium diazotrophicum]